MTRTTSVLDCAALAAAIFLAFTAAPLLGQPAGSTHPDLSGYWELRYDSMSIPPALLATPATAELAQAEVRHDLEAIRWCSNLGVPFIMGDRGPLDIRQSPTVIAMVARVQSSTRYIYTDGRKHPDKDDMEPSTNGHSIGHWEGDVLVVDTIGFNDLGATRIPGGGVRTPVSHLMERYRLLNGGARLSAVFTWEDPKVFQKPHTYEFRYYRIPRIDEPRILACDARDQERGRFLLGPNGDR